MRVFVTGGTGFVGQEILRQLVAAGHTARVLVRSDAGQRLPDLTEIETAPGDVLEPKTLSGALEDCDAVIHLVGIIREFPARGITFERLHVEAAQNLIAAACQQNVRRFIHMSANGSRKDAATAYHFTKWRAELALRESELDWTVFRPSLIYGRHDQFINMLAEQVRKLPAIPVLGDGLYPLSPVAVEDVARGFVAALSQESSINHSYACGGPQTVSYNQLLDAVASALGRTIPLKLHHPVWMMRPLIRMLEGFSAFPITSEQLTMLLEGNTCDPHPWCDAFKLELTPLDEGLKRMLAEDKVT